jgi:hypothetical protein
VHEVDGDLLGRQLPGQGQAGQHVQQLGVGIDVAAHVVLGGLEVLEGIWLPHLEAGRDHIDTAGGRAGLEQGKQLAGQGERPDEVHGQGGLVPVGGLPAALVQAADVVDQHVQAADLPADLVGQLLVAAHGGVVGLQEPHLVGPLWRRIAAAACSPASASRPVMSTCAPRWARAQAVW